MTKGMDIKGKNITVNLDRERSLRYDLNAICMIEDRYNDVNEFLRSLQKPGPGMMTKIRFLIWAGLLHEDPELTEQDVGRMIDVNNMEEVQQSIMEAMKTGMPDAEESKKKKAAE